VNCSILLIVGTDFNHVTLDVP